MTDFVQITTTTGGGHDAEQIAAGLLSPPLPPRAQSTGPITSTFCWAEQIAAELISRRLAACAQVTGPITSTFRWQGKVENADEWMCTAKTGRQQLAAIQKLLDEIHPYEVPELIATPIVDGSAAYLKW